MLKIPVTKKDHIEGPDTAIVTLVEYGDYQCPYCGSAYPIIKNIQQKLKDKIRFVFRNFPLQEMHPNAFTAAMAAEAAGRQGAYWPMHDVIFENQDKLKVPDLIRHATALKLNVKKFEADLKDEGLKEKIENDIESGVRSGVNGTPAFFINGKRYDGAWDDEGTLLQVLMELVQ